MSWGEVFKINSNMNASLNKQLRNRELYEAWCLTSTTTFTPPVSGVYKVICIGKGADGSGSATSYVGGSAGGVVIGLLELSSTQSYNVTVSSNASFSNLLTATAGAANTGGSGSGGTVYDGGKRNGGSGGNVGVYIAGAMEYPITAENVGGVGLYGGAKSSKQAHNFSTSDVWRGTVTICSSGGGYGAGGAAGSYANKGSGVFYSCPGGEAAVVVILIEEGGEL